MTGLDDRPIADRIDGVAVPAQCEAVVGHEQALQRLFESYRIGRMHHAWLISGPRGVGKASLASLFAKYMFCNPDPANLSGGFDPESISLPQHRQVAQGAHPQLLHLTRPWDDKAKRFKSQLSVDEIRRTQGFYGMTAGAGGWRITIVDAADEMNASAANALLKVLEEPPSRSLFFVLSHSTGKLLATGLPGARSPPQVAPRVAFQYPKPQHPTCSKPAGPAHRKAAARQAADIWSE